MNSRSALPLCATFSCYSAYLCNFFCNFVSKFPITDLAEVPLFDHLGHSSADVRCLDASTPLSTLKTCCLSTKAGFSDSVRYLSRGCCATPDVAGHLSCVE
jgi:hypothetical protein